MFRITPHYLDVRTNKQKVVDKRISAKNVFLSASRTVAVQNGQKVTKQSDFLRVSQKLRGQNFAIFWPPPPCVDSFYTHSMDKNRHFWPPSPHLFIHKILEWPLMWPLSLFVHRQGDIMVSKKRVFKHFIFILSFLDCFKIFLPLCFDTQLEISSSYTNLLIGFFSCNFWSLPRECKKIVCQITLLKLGRNPTQYLHL